MESRGLLGEPAELVTQSYWITRAALMQRTRKVVGRKLVETCNKIKLLKRM